MNSRDHILLALVQMSDRLVLDAHALLPAWQDEQTRQNESRRGLVLYNTYIKQALNSLFKALRQFSSTMDASIQAFLYYKIAGLLYKETASLNLASEYCTKGINLCKKNEPKLSMTKLKLQYLHFQILFLVGHSSSQSLSYLNDIISDEIPKDPRFINVKYFFMFIKFKHYGNIFTTHKNMITLKTVLETDNFEFKQLVLLHLIEYQLSNNFGIDEITYNLQTLDALLTAGSLLQYRALRILIDFQMTLYAANLQNIEEKIHNLDNFIKMIKKTKKLWQSVMTINFSIGSTDRSYPVEIKWLSFKEFTTISYFYCSVLYSFKSWDNRNKSDKIFKMISPTITNNKKSSFNSLDDLQKHLVRINYMKIISEVYQLISDFVKDSIPLSERSLFKYPKLYSFIETYNDKLSGYETIVYNALIPLVKYIFAVINQRNGNFYKALLLYSDVITTKQEQSSVISTILSQEAISFTNNEQLKLISTLNAIPIVQYIIENEKETHLSISEFDLNYDQAMEKFSKLLKLKDTLLESLNSTTVTFNSEIISVAVQSIKYFYDLTGTNFSFDSIDLTCIQFNSPLLASLLYLVKGYTYKFDLGLSTLENLNKKVSCFTNACMYSTKACDNNNPNEISRLGYFEIFKIMNHNKNLYSEEDIEKVSDKLKLDSKSNLKKRVKFV